MTVSQKAPEPIYDLPGSAFIVCTGNTNDGKSYQEERLLAAEIDGRPLIAPVLMLVASASTEGPAGEIMSDESMCLVWPVTTCDDALDALTTCFPEGRTPLTLGEARAKHHEKKAAEAKAGGLPPPPAPRPTPRDAWPLRAVAVDEISALYSGQMASVGNAARKPGGAKPEKVMKSAEVSMREQAKVAMPRCIALIDRLSGICQRHRGTLVFVACHVRKQIEQMKTSDGEVFRSVVGWAPDLGRPEEVKAGVLATGYSTLWQTLAFKANNIWHLFSIAPDLQQVPLAEINRPGPGRRPTYGAITMRGTYPTIGHVGWVKRQGGDGWLGFFDELPPFWHPSAPWEHGEDFPSPDLGAVLVQCVQSWRERQRGGAAA